MVQLSVFNITHMNGSMSIYLTRVYINHASSRG